MILKKIALLLVLVACMASCDNEVQLNAPFKDIPVVYSLLSMNDTAHYVRLEKAFLVENESALELARDPNQLYYESAEVNLIHESDGTVFTLKRVKGADEGYVREDGVFAEDPNYLYKVTQNDIMLEENDKIKLEINRGEDLDVITANTSVIGDMKINQPNPDFAISFRENAKTRIRWTEKANASFYSVKLYLKYLEQNIDNSDEYVEKTLEWPIKENVGINSHDFDGISFFTFLASSLEKGDNYKRIFSRVDILVDAGGIELQKYIEQGLVNIGITGSQEIDAYTNLNEGVGVFSTRNSIFEKNYNISAVTRDSLLDGRFTKELNFE